MKEIFEKLDRKLERVVKRNLDKLPYSAAEGVFDNKYETDVCWWTNGFYPGLCWVMYNATKKECYLTAARRAQELLKEAFKERDGLHHDVGFMWYLSEGADFRLTGRKEARDIALYAADMLMGRFNLKGKFIRAWNDENGVDRSGWTIIDCMMNIPLLYWASEVTGDERYALVAMAHADMAMRDHVRSDGSTNHICIHDGRERELTKVLGGQGYGEKSCWSRGNSWAVYGFIQSYMHTKEKKYLDTAIRCADYFIENLKDGVVRCDFNQPDEPLVLDTSAAMIASAGMVEIFKATGDEKYKEAAELMIKTADENFCDWDEARDGIVGMCSESYKSPAVHKNLIYADFYLAEAVCLLLGFERTN